VSRPLLLLPPSKGKATGGDGLSYGETLDGAHPLGPARRKVLAAVTDTLGRLDLDGLARLLGVPARKVDDHLDRTRDLERAPTMPAHRRYTGIVHGNAGLATLDPRTAGVEIVIVSALMGLVGLEEPVPDYRLEFAASVQGLGGLATFWRDAAGEQLATITADRAVWDLLPGEHARIWPPASRAGREVHVVRFVRPDGRAANAARTKVAKGRLVAHLVAAPGTRPGDLVGSVMLGPGWTLAAHDADLVATYDG
jgi:uncharacterized protein